MWPHNRAELISNARDQRGHQQAHSNDKSSSPDCDSLRAMNVETNFANFWPVYVRAHSRPGTRAIHLAGTLAGWMLLVAASVTLQRWWFVRTGVDFPLFLSSTTGQPRSNTRCGHGGRIKRGAAQMGIRKRKLENGNWNIENRSSKIETQKQAVFLSHISLILSPCKHEKSKTKELITEN